MRNRTIGNHMVVRAVAGLHVVSLGWDFLESRPPQGRNLLGFAVERSELEGGQVVERYWLRGIKRFQFKDEGAPPGTPMPLSEHPYQGFQWGDYTAKPGRTYRYRVVPVFGQSKNLELDERMAVEIEIGTEPESDSRDVPVRHDIFFNRGAAGSQAYARKFSGTRPNQHEPSSEQMTWLSRGLFEALTGFIRLANGPRFSLRAALYEFKYAPVAAAFREARESGADVRILYEADSYKSENEETIRNAGIEDICRPQGDREGIRHNKFILLLEDDKPVAVWTGSTNISAGGIFGHSNVGHVVWNGEIAGRFLEYWKALADPDIKLSELKRGNVAIERTPAPGEDPPRDRVLALFSPRDPVRTVPTLNWYGDLLASAEHWAGMTFAFNFDEIFVKALEKDTAALRYLLFDKSLNRDVQMDVERDGRTVVASGAKLEAGDLELFIGETLSGFNRNLYIHDKFIVVDPLGDDPVVVTGTANFSKNSQHTNDENMLVIRGDTRVGDIYFGEFLRIFDHLYVRYLTRRMREVGKGGARSGYLKERGRDWIPAHYRGAKALRRSYFVQP